jgi:hypothetical protein
MATLWTSGFIDEAFAHQDDAVEQSMTPAMITRPSSQLWVLSAAGDGKSKYLWRKILAGRSACESGQHGRTCYFEWSAPDDLDPSDPATWAVACPALGFRHANGSGITEAKLAYEWDKAVRNGQDGVDLFRRSFLCQWPEVPVLGDDMGEWVIPEAEWNACEDVNSGPVGDLSFALDVSPMRDWSTFAVAARSGRGGIHVELTSDEAGTIDRRPGTAWVVDRAKELQKRWGGRIAIAKRSPAWALPACCVDAVLSRRCSPACGCCPKRSRHCRSTRSQCARLLSEATARHGDNVGRTGPAPTTCRSSRRKRRASTTCPR